ncbi:MAG TPA: SRPBCC domain-containing protein [Dactylosporangium sp.]|jgi:hypothetical protein|nr:SRPBCC domain-containing protein [Dactylosporangium sp.]
MSENDYTAVITVDSSRQAAFDAAVNLRAWWSEEIVGDTDKLGAEFDYHYQETHSCRMRVTEYVPGRRVAWLVLDNHFSFTSDEEWVGTTVEIDLAEQDGRTEVCFTHRGLVPSHECYEVCQQSWDFFVGTSLLELITTGKGRPISDAEANAPVDVSHLTRSTN